MNPEFDALLTLIRVMKDPETHEKRLQELRDTIDAAAAKEAEAQAAQVALDTERSRLAKLDARVHEREVNVFEAERRHKTELDQLRKWQRDHGPSSRLIKVGPSGLVKEPDDSEPERDPITDHDAEAMQLAPEVAAVRTVARKSLRRVKV